MKGGVDGNVNLLIFVTLALDLDDSHLVLLGSGHQDSGLDEKPVAGLDLGRLLPALLQLLALLILILGLKLDRVPVILLVAAAQSAGPQVLLLYVSSGENSGHD